MQSESLFCHSYHIVLPYGLRVCAVLREILSFCVYGVRAFGSASSVGRWLTHWLALGQGRDLPIAIVRCRKRMIVNMISIYVK